MGHPMQATCTKKYDPFEGTTAVTPPQTRLIPGHSVYQVAVMLCSVRESLKNAARKRIRCINGIIRSIIVLISLIIHNNNFTVV